MSQLRNVKLSTPTYRETIPSTKKVVKIKPFRVGDEKTLLIAAQSEDSKQQIDSMKEVIRSCVEGIDVESLTSFDLEYLFLKLRAVSVGETSDIGIKCEHCSASNRIKVDLAKVGVVETEGHTKTVKISKELAFEMRYPDINDLVDLDQSFDSILNLVCCSVQTVFAGEEAITVTPAEHEDLKRILNDLTTTQFEDIQKFFSTSPKLKHEVKFKCSECGEDNKQTLEGLTNFF